MDAAALEAGLPSPEMAAAMAGHAPTLESPVLLGGDSMPGKMAGVSQHTPGLLPTQQPAALVAEPAHPMVPVSALGAAASAAAPFSTPGVQSQLSDNFYTAKEHQMLASGAVAGPTPHSTAASRPQQPSVAAAAGADAVDLAGFMAAGAATGDSSQVQAKVGSGAVKWCT